MIMMFNLFLTLLWELHIHITLLQLGILMLIMHSIKLIINVFNTISNVDIIYLLLKNRPLESIWTSIPLALIYWLMNLILITLMHQDMNTSVSTLRDVMAFQWFWTSSDNDICLRNTFNVGEVYALLTDTLITLLHNNIISIILTSGDVIHCFTVPSLGVKVDVIPGRISTLRVFLTALEYYTANAASSVGHCMGLCLTHYVLLAALGFVLIDVSALGVFWPPP